jgi:uncharacterized membrane protein YphA (DoxX/SURF4 family)
MDGSADFAYLLIRVLSCGVWLAAGLYKAFHFDQTAAEMTELGIPMASVALVPVLIMELLGSIAWILFMIPATAIYHARFMIAGGTINFPQMVQVSKNVSIAGGLLALIILDPSAPGWLGALLLG